jgi:hypothetical protein
MTMDKIYIIADALSSLYVVSLSFISYLFFLSFVSCFVSLPSILTLILYFIPFINCSPDDVPT